MTKDRFKIDSHKLMFHPSRIASWLKGENIYPIYLELGPSGACNHRCSFCGVDFIGYKAHFMDYDKLSVRIKEMGELGVKSIMYAGEGEPFLHKRMSDIVLQTKAAGIDVALTTNGVLMTPDNSEKILSATSWIKVSLNAGTAETYANVHCTDKKDFDRVLENLEAAVKIRKKQSSTCTLGAQILLLPENEDEVVGLAEICRNIGLDYLVVKPFSQHPQSESKRYKNISYEGYESLADRLNKICTDKFSVIFRLNAMKAWDAKEHHYNKCYGLPFWGHVDALGNMWGCSVYLQNERFLYGNIFEQTFEEVWNGEKRMESLQWCSEHLDPHNCRVNCRMDKINAYLWELKNPGPHVNFI